MEAVMKSVNSTNAERRESTGDKMMNDM